MRQLGKLERAPRCSLAVARQYLGAPSDGDVFIGMPTNISELDLNLASDLIKNFSRKTDAAWLSDCFETCGDVHTIAIETGIIEDDISLINTNPKLHLT